MRKILDFGSWQEAKQTSTIMLSQALFAYPTLNWPHWLLLRALLKELIVINDCFVGEIDWLKRAISGS